jgi:hypothetical protein
MLPTTKYVCEIYIFMFFLQILKKLLFIAFFYLMFPINWQRFASVTVHEVKYYIWVLSSSSFIYSQTA